MRTCIRRSPIFLMIETIRLMLGLSFLSSMVIYPTAWFTCVIALSCRFENFRFFTHSWVNRFFTFQTFFWGLWSVYKLRQGRASGKSKEELTRYGYYNGTFRHRPSHRDTLGSTTKDEVNFTRRNSLRRSEWMTSTRRSCSSLCSEQIRLRSHPSTNHCRPGKRTRKNRRRNRCRREEKESYT